MLGSVASASQNQVRQQSVQEPPAVRANAILAETAGRPSTYDRLGQIEARLDDIARTDPGYANEVRAAIMASPQLTPVQKAQLTANEPGRTVNVDGSRTQRFAPGGMAWDAWIDSNRARNTPEFQALARLAGSTENAPIREVMQQLNDRGITAAQFEAERAAAAGPSGATLTLDLLQMALDLTGIVDQSGISDGANAVVSLGRSISSLFSGEWSEAGGHLVNGAISVVGIVPAIGDLAKAGKIGKWAQTVSDAVAMMSRSPELARTLEPALREIKGLVDRIPQSALDALPSGARESIERMKTQLDEVFGAGARRVDDAGRAIVRNADGTINMDHAAQAYADAVRSNRPWSWADNFSGSFTAGERASIRREAIARGLVTEVPLKPGTRYADFNAAGLVERVDTLPRDLWLQSDRAQFEWLDARIPGGRPEGYTWHHTETPGRMELVPFGEHNITNHVGGRSPGHWAHAPR